MPEETEEKENEESNLDKTSLFLILFNLVLFSGLILLAISYYKDKTRPPKPQLEQESLSSPTQEPKEELDKSKYSLRVLNGSGVAGAAGQAAEALKLSGFENIETGNADRKNYQKTEVRKKKAVPEALFGEIREALSGNTLIIGSELPHDAPNDIVITVGSEKE